MVYLFRSSFFGGGRSPSPVSICFRIQVKINKDSLKWFVRFLKCSSLTEPCLSLGRFATSCERVWWQRSINRQIRRFTSCIPCSDPNWYRQLRSWSNETEQTTSTCCQYQSWFVYLNANGIDSDHRLASPFSGEQTSAESWGTGRAVARIPRVRGGGTHRSGQGAFGNMCRGGRMYAPLKVWRKWHRKINLKQRRYALVSAIAASGVPSLVLARG